MKITPIEERLEGVVLTTHIWSEDISSADMGVESTHLRKVKLDLTEIYMVEAMLGPDGEEVVACNAYDFIVKENAEEFIAVWTMVRNWLVGYGEE